METGMLELLHPRHMTCSARLLAQLVQVPLGSWYYSACRYKSVAWLQAFTKSHAIEEAVTVMLCVAWQAS